MARREHDKKQALLRQRLQVRCTNLIYQSRGMYIKINLSPIVPQMRKRLLRRLTLKQT